MLRRVPAVDRAGEGGLILSRCPGDAEEGGLDAEADALDGGLALNDVDDLLEGLRASTQKVGISWFRDARAGQQFCAGGLTWVGIVIFRGSCGRCGAWAL